MNNAIVLTTKKVTKRFDATLAVNEASFKIHKGEIRGLIGENGSGKTTFVSMIAGIHKMDSGEMEKDAKPYAPANIIDANRRGVSMIVQEMATIDGLSIAQNIFFGHEKMFSQSGILNTRKMNNAARELLAEFGLKDIDPNYDITKLSFEQRKLTEFAKALYNKPDVLIIDETTSALSQHGRGLLYKIMHSLKEEGKTVVFITHDLPELFEHCDNATVMRDGVIIGTYNVKDLNEAKVKSLMVGRELENGCKYYREDMICIFDKEVKFRVENLSKKDCFENICFEVHKGEILGIGGLTNCGMHELGRVLFGIEKPDSGAIISYTNNKEHHIKDTFLSVKNKIAYLSKNRDQESLMLSSNIADNIALPGLRELTKATFLSPLAKTRYAQSNTKQLSVKMSSIKQIVMHLSGGNKQKVAISKWIANKSKLFILDCPTRGIDVSVKADVYQLMQKFKSEGRSIIMISEELLELMGMCDRIMIMKQGEINGIVNRGTYVSEEILLNFMI